MRPRVALLITSLLLLASATPAGTVLIVSLRSSPDHVLLGVPPMLIVTATNSGNEAVRLDGRAYMHVTGPDGASFVALVGGDRDPYAGMITTYDDPLLLVPPGVARTYYLRPTTVARGPAFLGDQRFAHPGRFLLQLELLTPQPGVTFTSDTTTLTIEPPTGADAAVAAILNETLRRYRSDSGIIISAAADQATLWRVIGQYAASRYTPYIVGMYRGYDLALREHLLLEGLAQPVPASFATELKLDLLGLYSGEVGNSVGHWNLPLALSYQAKAAQMATELSKSELPYAVEAAKAALQDLPTPDLLRARFAEQVARNRDASLPIKPFVQCVDFGSGDKKDALIVTFGSDNPNAHGKYLPAGSSNRVRPDDAAHTAVPVYFAQGHRLNALVVVGKNNDDPISWALDGGVAAVTKNSPHCKLPASVLRVAPFLDCVKPQGELRGTFGYINPNDFAVRVPLGAANVTDGEGDLPVIFLPGEHHHVFTLKARKGTSASWTLQGTTVTASPGGLGCQDGEDVGD